MLVIGAQKCGTTSLHFYLDQHPEVSMARGKELNFFVERGSWSKGVDWYRSQFDPTATVRGESSPAYTNYPHHDGVPARMHSVVPEAKLVYMVRDPIERIVSQYVHEFTTGRENRPIETVLEDGLDTHPYVMRSKFFLQLERYLEFFPPESVLVASQEDLLLERRATMRRIFAFLGVDTSFDHPNFERIKHLSRDRRRRTQAGEVLVSVVRTATRPLNPPQWLAWEAETLLVFPFARRVDRPDLPAALHERLVRALEEDVARLREHTGQAFARWRL